MRVSLLPLALTLALVSGAGRSLAGGFNPIVSSLWQEKSRNCGEMAQMARSYGIATTGHEATMLMAAQKDGADENDLSILSMSYTLGEITAMGNGYHDGSTASKGTREYEAGLKKLRKNMEELLRTCTESLVASVDQERRSDQAMKERERVLAIQNALVRQIQKSLLEMGYYEGKVDGLYGPQTKRAIEQYEQDRGLTITGKATQELFADINREHRRSSFEPNEMVRAIQEQLRNCWIKS